ncbi:MAG TPA: tRNA pseudouridine(38-40) synthase TruA [Blastocatellia bacterium]
MRNVKLTIQYDGTNYQGWQTQSGGPTIQGELTKVISMLDQRPVVLRGAGRTDSGVHAEGQVATCLIERDFSTREFRDAINGNISRDIRVMHAEYVDERFHARISAKQKTYRYQIWTGEVMSPFTYRYFYHIRSPLSADEMQRAAAYLLGNHDFSAFVGTGADTESNVRTLYQLHVETKPDHLVVTARANGFLRYMVRTIVGTLIEVGRRRRPPESLLDLLSSLDRGQAGQTAPAAGLTLVRVDY